MEREELVYKQLMNRLGEDVSSLKLNPVNILPIVANTVSLTEKYVVAPGEEKKKVVYSVVTKLMENVEVNDKELVLNFLTNQFSNFIDTLVGMSNGTYKMNYAFAHLKQKFNCTGCQK